MDILFDPGLTGGMLLAAAEATAEVEAESGGLFDFGATLLLQFFNFFLLLFALNAFFFRPISRVVEERSEYVRSNATSAQRRFDEAKALAEQYEAELRTTRIEAQQVIAQAEAEAQRIRAQQVAQAQAEVQARLDAARTDLERQKQTALTSLEAEVDSLSRRLSEKLLSGTAGGAL